MQNTSTTTNFCHHCGHQRVADAAFCPRCGTLITAPDERTAHSVAAAAKATTPDAPDMLPHAPAGSLADAVAWQHSTIRSRAKWAYWVLVATAVGAVLAAMSSFQQFILARQLIASIEVTPQQIVASDTQEQALAVIQLMLLTSGAVTFVRWMTRAYASLDLLAPGPRQLTLSQVRWSFFIPFICIVRPHTALKETWLQSIGASSAPVTWWWGAWIAHGAIDGMVSTLNISTPTELATASILGVVAHAITAWAALLAAFVVKRISEAQQKGLLAMSLACVA
jgi:hypothetical protein